MAPFTGNEEVFVGYNRRLYFTTESSNALPTDVSPTYTFTEIGYDDGFSFNENENEQQIYNKRVKSHKKKGRKEYTFEVSHMYAGVDMSIFLMKGKEGTLKVVTEDDAGVVQEVNYFHKAYINSPQFNGGTDEGVDTVSASGDYSDRFLYDSDATGAVLLYATDGSHETP